MGELLNNKLQRDFLRVMLEDTTHKEYTDFYLNKVLEIADSELGKVMTAYRLIKIDDETPDKDFIDKLYKLRFLPLPKVK
jgi:hypothetical protein